mmetsp:Transcript_31123/g.101717  ORF Transcript_31123/g.101717 Transcript_31123/m.101717 type:complete len:275 (-) Transcript_31123:768-1592(-)
MPARLHVHRHVREEAARAVGRRQRELADGQHAPARDKPPFGVADVTARRRDDTLQPQLTLPPPGRRRGRAFAAIQDPLPSGGRLAPFRSGLRRGARLRSCGRASAAEPKRVPEGGGASARLGRGRCFGQLESGWRGGGGGGAHVRLHAVHEGGEAAEAGREGGEALELVDDDGEVSEDVVEGARRLGDHAELDGAGKVERRHDEHGQDLDQVRVPHREELEVALRAEDRTLVLDGAAQSRDHLLLLLRLSAVESDRLRILAQPHERVAQVRLPQ